LNQQFVEDLVTLKKLYQLQQAEMEREKGHAIGQLSHINALLVDQMVEEQRFVESLAELRNRYQEQAHECERKASHAREQITHVNALIADQLVQRHNQQPFSIQASTVRESPALTEAAVDIASQEFPFPEDEIEQVLAAVDGDKQQELASPITALEVVQPQLKTEVDFIDNSQKTQNQSSPLKSPTLPQYKNLMKLEAVETILRSKAGSILHIDWLIRALHGELAEDELKAERGRMSQTLSNGVKKELWDKVPNESGCYTINLELVEPDLVAKAEQTPIVTAPPKSQSERSDLQPKMLPAYTALKSIDAVDLVINEKAGQVLTTDLVVKALYGKLSGTKLTKAKEIIGRALWRGAEAKRWQRVPGKQKGAYTLDLRLLKSEPKTS